MCIKSCFPTFCRACSYRPPSAGLRATDLNRLMHENLAPGAAAETMYSKKSERCTSNMAFLGSAFDPEGAMSLYLVCALLFSGCTVRLQPATNMWECRVSVEQCCCCTDCASARCTGVVHLVRALLFCILPYVPKVSQCSSSYDLTVEL